MHLTVICKSKTHHGTLTGAAAHHFQKGDCIIVAAFAVRDKAITPRMIPIDQNNQLIRDLGDHDQAWTQARSRRHSRRWAATELRCGRLRDEP